MAFAEPSDLDCPSDLDPVAFVARAATRRPRPDRRRDELERLPGVTLAGALAAELGLAGARPERLITAAHKYYSRIAQRAAAPEAVPEFALVDLRARRSRAAARVPVLAQAREGLVLGARAPDRRTRRSSAISSRRAEVREFGLGDYLAIFNRMVAALHRPRRSTGAR